jgi:hypothetical protein
MPPSKTVPAAAELSWRDIIEQHRRRGNFVPGRRRSC